MDTFSQDSTDVEKSLDESLDQGEIENSQNIEASSSQEATDEDQTLSNASFSSPCKRPLYGSPPATPNPNKIYNDKTIGKISHFLIFLMIRSC